MPRLCSVCGNEIGGDVTRCPFCESPQETGRRPAAKRQRVRTVKLKAGQPSVEEALKRLDAEVAAARASGVRVLRLIHGYGSTGVGGDIKTAVLRRLRSLQDRGAVRSYLPGDTYTEVTAEGRMLLEAHPDLRATLRTDRLNPGLTIVVVR